MNPFVPFFLSKNNQRLSTEENIANVNSALEIYWKPYNRLTLYSQVLIEDIDFKEENRKKFPSRLGLSGKLILTDYFINGLQLSAGYNRLSNWTYNSFYTWGNYVYNNKSLGYPKNRVENFRADIDYFGKPPFIISSSVMYERSGVQDLSAAFIAEKTEFPLGVVQNNISIDLSVKYFPANYLNAEMYLQWQKYDNYDYMVNKEKTNLTVGLSAHYYLNKKIL